MKPERNWHSHEASSSTNVYRGQQDTSHYQPTDYNQRQQYRHDITTKQFSYRTDYDRGEVEKYGIIHSGIPTPYIKQVPFIPFGNEHQ